MVNWHDDKEVARRAAEISPFTFEEALEAIEEGGEERLLIVGMIRDHEDTQRFLARLRETRRELIRARPWLFS